MTQDGSRKVDSWNFLQRMGNKSSSAVCLCTDLESMDQNVGISCSAHSLHFGSSSWQLSQAFLFIL